MTTRLRPAAFAVLLAAGIAAVNVASAAAVAGSPNIAGAQTIVSAQQNTGDETDPFFRVQMSLNDRMTTDITFGSDNLCTESAYLYSPSVTDFTLFNATPSRTFTFDCVGDTQYQWSWTSPFSGLGTLDIPSGQQAYTFTTTIRHGTTTALSPLVPVRRLGSLVRLSAKVTSPAGTPVGFCEVYRRYGKGKWRLRRQLHTGLNGGCRTTLSPGLRGHWRYRVAFTSGGGDWVASRSPVRSTLVR
jgi:hypothetical protein